MESPAESNSSLPGRQIARAAGTVMLAFILSNLVGLARQIIIAGTFGTGADLEAFNAANRVGETLFLLTAGGALGSAFIPTFTGLLAKDQRADAWRLAARVGNTLLLLLILVSTAAAIAAPWIVRNLLAAGFPPEQQALTVSLLRLLLPSVVIFGLSGLIMGVLNAHQRFLVPALTPSFYGLGMIVGVLALSPSLGIFGLAWGVLLGSSLHLLLQIPSLLSLRGTYRLDLGWKDSHLRQVGALMLPRLFGVAVEQLNFWVNTLIASYLPQGSLNGIVYGFQLMMMPQAAIAQSVAIAAMPTFSAQAALDRMDELRHTLASSLRVVILLSLPASVGLVFLAQPLVAMVYERNVFTAESTLLVAWALAWYAAGLVGHSVVEVIRRAFYAIKDTRTPVTIGAGAMALNVAFSLGFSAWFEQLGWMPHGGLALANSTATAIEMLFLILVLRKRLRGLEGAALMDGVFKTLIAAVVMGIGLLTWNFYSSGAGIWIHGGLGVLIGMILYGSMLYLLRVPELTMLARAFARRLRR